MLFILPLLQNLFFFEASNSINSPLGFLNKGDVEVLLYRNRRSNEGRHISLFLPLQRKQTTTRASRPPTQFQSYVNLVRISMGKCESARKIAARDYRSQELPIPIKPKGSNSEIRNASMVAVTSAASWIHSLNQELCYLACGFLLLRLGKMYRLPKRLPIQF